MGILVHGEDAEQGDSGTLKCNWNPNKILYVGGEKWWFLTMLYNQGDSYFCQGED